MSRTVIGLLIVAGWSMSGLLIGIGARRRGHHRAWLVFGAVCGPLTWGLWRAHRVHRSAIRPKVVAVGRSGPGPVDVVVTCDGSAASHLALTTAVELLADRIGHLEIATVIDFDTALATNHDGADPDQEAARTVLHDAAARLVGSGAPRPGLVVLAGASDDAVATYARGRADVVVTSDARAVSRALHRRRPSAGLEGRVPAVLVIGPSPGDTTPTVAHRELRGTAEP